MNTLAHTKFDNNEKPNWCPGCGNFGIWVALKNALVAYGAKAEQTVVVGDIGCSSKTTDYIQTNTFSGLHGRAIPVAEGVKLANHRLTVIALGGDGGIYGEGGNHLIHAARRNIDMTVIVHNNKVYGLTKGQTSPTSDQGFKTDVTPEGSLEIPFNPLMMALSAGATYVARGFAGDNLHLINLITEGIHHRGFALIDVLQPCVTFNHVESFSWYYQRVYKIEDQKDYSPTDFPSALTKSQEWGDHIPIGILYHKSRPVYEDQLPALQSKTLVNQSIEQVDIAPLLNLLK